MSKLFIYMLLTVFATLIASIFLPTEQRLKGLLLQIKPSLKGSTGWHNTKPLSLEELHGRVVLIDFWTYTCINWRRTLPYIREWRLKYKDQGLVVIGIHTPEFSFEHQSENVIKAIKEMNIDYPVAADNNFGIWNSFQNAAWPALYLVDGNGKIRYQKFGEGDYHEIELQIQKLLKEVSAKNVSDKTAELHPEGFEAAADWSNLLSPENYVGYNQSNGFVSPEGIHRDQPATFTLPKKMKLNQWGLSGEWIMGSERVLLTKAEGKIIYHFHARDLHLVMGPVKPGTSIQFRILIDGNPPLTSHGLDVDKDGNGTVKEARMYQLIRQQGTVIEREFQIEFLAPDIEVYDFTFG